MQAGNQTAPSFAQPGLWAFIDGLEEKSRPVFLRGDCHWGAENAMAGAEERDLRYLFKLKQGANVKKLIGQIFHKEEWEAAGQGWEGRTDELRLSGWSFGQKETRTQSWQTDELGSGGGAGLGLRRKTGSAARSWDESSR